MSHPGIARCSKCREPGHLAAACPTQRPARNPRSPGQEPSEADRRWYDAAPTKLATAAKWRPGDLF